MRPSSQDLHPSTGARFVFEREADGPHGHRYRVNVYLADGRTLVGELAWPDGNAQLQPDAPPEPEDQPLAWAHAEALKLARTLRRTPKQHMVRWRGSS